MFKRFKNIKITTLIPHILVTLAYPAVKAFISSYNRLLIFTDAMTIVGIVLVIGGIIYAMLLRGDYDISGYVLHRGANREKPKSFDAYKQDMKDKRAGYFNYPLFLGILYLAAALAIAYIFY